MRAHGFNLVTAVEFEPDTVLAPLSTLSLQNLLDTRRWKAASLQAGSGGENTGKKTTGAGGGAKSGASKNSLGSAIALALAEEGGFVE